MTEKLDNDKKNTLRFSQGNQNSEAWFVAKDVCEVLDLKDVSMSLQKLDDDKKLTQKIFVSGQARKMWTINESGLYTLILRSTKPNDKSNKN